MAEETSIQRSRSKRTGLGRGLGALIPDSSPRDHESNGGPLELLLDTIQPNPWQPRLDLDPAELEELVGSIRAHGVIQPVIVARTEANDSYYLIAGERRWRAARLAGLEVVPAIVKDVTSQQMLELALVENVVRSDLSPLEEAQAYQQLIEEFGLTQQDVANRVGRARVTVANTLRLLAAPDRVKEALASGSISEGHARALLSLPTAFDQLAMMERLIARDWSVRQTESAVRAFFSDSPPTGSNHEADDGDWETLEQATRRLERRLQTRITVKRSAQGKGSITIVFSDPEHLADLVSRIAGEDLF